MVIGPIIFCTVVTGIAGMEDMKKVGRVGGKALLYFEIVSTFALVLGLLAAHVLKPGVGFNIDPATLDGKAVASYAAKAHGQTTVDFLMHIIPDTLSSAFAQGEILQILLIALLFGAVLATAGEKGKRRDELHRRACRMCCSASCASSRSSRRSARSARWRSPSASTASARCCRCSS